MAQQPQKKKPTRAADIFSHPVPDPFLLPQQIANYLVGAGNDPALPGESNLSYGIRKLVGSPFAATANLGGWLGNQIDEGLVYAAQPAIPAAPPAVVAKPAAQAANTGAPVQAVAQDFSRDAVASMANWVRNRGGRVTSMDRSAADNKRVGGVANSYHLTGRAFDSVPPQGMQMGEWHAELRAKFPGWDVINEGDHVHVEPPGGSGSGMNIPGFVSPFDSRYHNQALGELARGEAAALQPQTLGTRGPAPEVPDLVMPAKADFSAADSWLAQMKPVEMLETEKKKIEREGWFKGLAQAASSIGGSEGIGTMFLRLGAGALGGAMAGKDEVRARMDQFDKKMTQWQLLNFQNEGAKAQVVAQEARNEAALLNAHAMDKFRVAYQQWQMDGPQVVGDAVITTKLGEDGSRTLTRTPLQGPIMSAFALHRAQTLSALGGLQNNANSMVASAVNGLLANEAQTMFYDSLSNRGVSGQEAQDAMVTSQALAATNVVKYGRLLDVIPDIETRKDSNGLTLMQEVDTQLQAIGIRPGEEGYSERREMAIAERLLRMSLANKELMQRIMDAGGGGLVMSAADRFNRRTERQSVDSRGRPSQSTTFRGEE